MKIAHAFHTYYPVLGGMERVTQKLAEEEAKLGHEVHIITSVYGAECRPREEIINGVHVHRSKIFRMYYPDLMCPIECSSITSKLKKLDIIHLHAHISLFNMVVAMNAKRLGKPIVMDAVGVDYLKGHFNPIIRFFGYKYQKTITKLLAGLADLVVVTNNHEGEILEERYGVKSVVIPHGVDEQYLKTPNMANYFRSKYDVQGRIIAYIGRIHPTKGLDMLIRAFAKVAKEESDVNLVIAGKGEANYLKKCIELIRVLGFENKVKYLGYVSEEDKIGLIDSSEFVVIPSRHAGESYPLVVDEVKARGKPLVVTNYGALPYRIVNLVEGVVVNADPSSLARGLYYALSNKQSFRILSRPLTWREVAGKMLSLYQSIAISSSRLGY